ncbi:hypothetical protein SAMN05421541_104606 [Actinoplanes philippinensis]|uniref:Uncharacterized protein n=1 Tax=Actinoplanes philippinensis TaxID=35752 RepID=A0A1I2EQ83_9ACTN|nr:hypothetical protein SAMN05421541_104606 [Actinoplanes philippinensis]
MAKILILQAMEDSMPAKAFPCWSYLTTFDCL